MPTVNDLWRSYLLNELGLSDSSLTVNDLEFQFLSNTQLGSLSSERKFRTGGYYVNDNPGANVQTASPSLNVLGLFPFPVGESKAFDRIAAAVPTAYAATAVARLGIYNSDADGIPSGLVFGSGTVAVDTTGLKEFTIAVTLSKGLYWVGLVVQVTAATGAWQGMAGGTSPWVPISDPTANTSGAGITQTGVSGALPDPFVYTPGSIYTGANPKISLRAA